MANRSDVMTALQISTDWTSDTCNKTGNMSAMVMWIVQNAVMSDITWLQLDHSAQSNVVGHMTT